MAPAYWEDPSVAAQFVADPSTPPQMLELVLQAHPELARQISFHPLATPELRAQAAHLAQIRPFASSAPEAAASPFPPASGAVTSLFPPTSPAVTPPVPPTLPYPGAPQFPSGGSPVFGSSPGAAPVPPSPPIGGGFSSPYQPAAFGSGGQGGPPPSSGAPTKGSSKAIWIVLVIVLAILIAAGLVLALVVFRDKTPTTSAATSPSTTRTTTSAPTTEPEPTPTTAPTTEPAPTTEAPTPSATSQGDYDCQTEWDDANQVPYDLSSEWFAQCQIAQYFDWSNGAYSSATWGFANGEETFDVSLEIWAPAPDAKDPVVHSRGTLVPDLTAGTCGYDPATDFVLEVQQDEFVTSANSHVVGNVGFGFDPGNALAGQVRLTRFPGAAPDDCETVVPAADNVVATIDNFIAFTLTFVDEKEPALLEWGESWSEGYYIIVHDFYTVAPTRPDQFLLMSGLYFQPQGPHDTFRGHTFSVAGKPDQRLYFSGIIGPEW